jgi:NAD(P)-dependent dehydrogenase (short-subunit alcohol dehydrogenase family)
MKIQDSVVFITGANRGLGLAFAHAALRRGAKKVYAGVRSPTEANTPESSRSRLAIIERPPQTAGVDITASANYFDRNMG